MSLDGIIDPDDLFHEVIHLTTYYHSGWGTQKLTPDKLGITFSFPAWLHAEGLQENIFSCIPVQIMDACLQLVVSNQLFQCH
jgi:hypothetical protein